MRWLCLLFCRVEMTTRRYVLNLDCEYDSELELELELEFYVSMRLQLI